MIKKTRKPPPYPEPDPALRPTAPDSRPAGGTSRRRHERRRRTPRRAAGGGAPPPAATGRGPAGPPRHAGRGEGAPAVLQQLPRPRGPSPGSTGRGGRRRAVRGRRRRLTADLGEHGAPRAPRAAARRLRGLPGDAAVRFGVPRQHGHDRGAREQRPSRLLGRAQPRQHHRRLPDLRARAIRIPPRGPRAPRVGAPKGWRRGAPDRHRRGLLDGRGCRPHRGPAGPRATLRVPLDGR